MHSEIVATRQWISGETYATVFALARITPGTNLLAFCAGVAWELQGFAGAIASLLVVLLTRGYDAFRTNSLAMAAIGGILASAVGMMAAAAWQLARPYLDRQRGLKAVAMTGSAIALSLGLHLSPIQVIGLAAVAGALWRIPE